MNKTNVKCPSCHSKKLYKLIYMFIFHYNFIRPHGTLNYSTPTEVADFNTNDSNKNYWFIAA